MHEGASNQENGEKVTKEQVADSLRQNPKDLTLLNKFLDSQTNRITFVKLAPFDMDTSYPIRLVWTWFATSTGVVRFTVRWVHTTDGAALSTSDPGAKSESSANIDVDVTANDTQITTETNLIYPNVIARYSSSNFGGDLLWMSLERDGSADANTGNVILVNVIPHYLSWNTGGHR